jgi:pyruvate dehydrogenase E2 component (dihydrolipoamide acetyltransferase)
LSAAEMQGGCFTITNLGGFGIEAFTPIINYPEVAVLGLGAIIWEAAALEDGTLTSRQLMTLSLTFDHRILDGAPAARFLQTLRQRMEEPFAWLF